LKELGQPKDSAEILLELQSRSHSHQFWGSREMYILIFAFLILAGLLFLWAAYIRKPKRRHTIPEGKSPKNLFHSSHRRRKKYRHSRGSGQRNPTLSETGGLPPPKNNGAISNLL
jgi:hypothetical protein